MKAILGFVLLLGSFTSALANKCDDQAGKYSVALELAMGETFDRNYSLNPIPDSSKDVGYDTLLYYRISGKTCLWVTLNESDCSFVEAHTGSCGYAKAE